MVARSKFHADDPPYKIQSPGRSDARHVCARGLEERFQPYCISVFNPLKTTRICFIYGLSAYRAVNTLHFGYKNESLNVL
jgi:hypothetical protein